MILQLTPAETLPREFVATLKDEDLALTVEFAIDQTGKHSMPLGELMHHADNHAPGNVDTFLTMPGGSVSLPRDSQRRSLATCRREDADIQCHCAAPDYRPR